MNDTMKKLTDQIKTDLSVKVADKASVELVAKTKAAGDSDSGTFKVIISTADVDRQGESVDQNGWDLSFYKMNPVVLWGHDYSSLPIGVCTSIAIEAGKLVAEGKFAPEDCNPFAQQVRRLYDSGMVKTTSVGFIPKEFDPRDGSKIIKAELLEFSFVPVPANPYALTMRQMKDLKLDEAMLTTKGLKLEVKEEAPVEPVEEVKPEPPAEEKPVAPVVAPVEPATETSITPDEVVVTETGKTMTLSMKKGDKVVGTFALDEKTTAGFLAAARARASKETSDALNTLSVALTDAASSLKEIALQTGEEEVEEVKTGAVPKEMNDFLFARELIKGLDKTVGNALEKFNVRIRERSVITKK